MIEMDLEESVNKILSFIPESLGKSEREEDTRKQE
jgi:hypothetical protein